MNNRMACRSDAAGHRRRAAVGALFVLMILAILDASPQAPAPAIDSRASAIAVDRSGNVFVTGFSNALCTTIKYDAAGKRLWLRQLSGNPAAIATDAAGNVYVAGGNHAAASWDVMTVKYNNDGKLLWQKIYAGPAGDSDEASAVAVDGSGNVYVTGFSTDSNGKKDFCTIKYDAAGKQKWVKRYNGRADGDDRASAIALDAAGNAYVAGRSERPKTGTDFTTIKYDTAGTRKWVKHFSGPFDGDDAANSLALDASGAVYVTGTFQTQLASWDCATLKYSAGGKLQWLRRYNGPDNSGDRGIAVAVDAAGRICVAATSPGKMNDFAAIQYDSAGAERWASRYDGVGGQDEAEAMAVDGSGNVVVIGYSWSATEADYATVKYDSAGVEQWRKRYNGPANKADYPKAVAVDADNNVYVTGYGAHATRGNDFVTIKYSADGALKWLRWHDRP